MKRKVISSIVVLALLSTIVCSKAFVVDTKAISDVMTMSEMTDAIKDGVKEFKRTHIKNKDGSRTELDEFKKSRATKKRNNLPNYYVAPYTSIKDQDSFGSCWMFGEVSSVESNLLSKAGYPSGLQESDPIDLSEAQGVFVQYNKQTKTGVISGEVLTESCNDSEKSSDRYYGYNEGGWAWDASMAYTADKACVFESDNPYRAGGDSATDSRTMAEIAAASYRLNRFNIKSAEQLPEVFPVEKKDGVYTRYYNPENREIWKQKIIANGAISSNYYQSSSSIYNRTWGYDKSQYGSMGPNFWYHDATAKAKYSTNHVITVVGFNDNYSKYHYITKYTSQSYDELVGEIVYIKLDDNSEPDMSFDEDGSIKNIQTSDTPQEGYQAYIVPKEDGAWLIKNSYGTVNGNYKMYDDGIMYMSYCEETLSESISTVVEDDLSQINNEEKTFDTTLSHSSMMGQRIPSFATEVKVAEVYSIGNDKDIELGQIGYWTGKEDTVSRFKVYGSLTDRSDPESGTLLFDTGEVTDAYIGYHTFDIAQAVTLTHSTNVSIVAEQTCGEKSGLMIEAEDANDPDYLYNCKTNDTKYFDGEKWIDAKTLDQKAREDGITVGNSTVKMFGNEKDIEPESTTAPKYTVTVDGVETVVEEGQSFTFPTTSENGYTNEDYTTLYASGQTITPDEDITATSISDLDFSMVKGASVDLSGRNGIKFCAVATGSDVGFLNSSSVECGTLITPHDIFIDELEENLDLESAEKAGTNKVIKVVNSGWDQAIVGRFAAGVIHIKPFNWSREMVAESYITINYSDGSSKTLYSDLSPTRSIKRVVEILRDMGYPGLTEEQIEMLQKYLQGE